MTSRDLSCIGSGLSFMFGLWFALGFDYDTLIVVWLVFYVIIKIPLEFCFVIHFWGIATTPVLCSIYLHVEILFIDTMCCDKKGLGHKIVTI